MMVEEIQGGGDARYGEGPGNVGGGHVETQEFKVGADTELHRDEGVP